jgi:nicotinamide-nucleotide amidase
MGPIRRAEIIAAGSELLTPYRVDTNSLFLTARLNELGVVVGGKSVVGDQQSDLATIFRQACQRADVVIVTGGLGPTADDVTREAVAEVLNLPLEEHADILETIRARFHRRGARMPAINRRQAMVPAGAMPLANDVGTAPGLMIETQDRLVVLLPGPPRELKPMFEAFVAPRIAQAAGGRLLRRRVVKVTGRSESQVEELSQPVYSTFGEPGIAMDTTILATPGQIELHVSALGADPVQLERALDEAVRRLEAAIGSPVFSSDGRTLEAVVGDLLHERGWRVAAAESCTGGGLVSRMTDVPGSSAWVVGGIVAYANEVKTEQLGVPASLIIQHGAVSEPVAQAMAEGARLRLNANIGVGITGIAGPGGGSADKPVGTVAIAVAGRELHVRTFLFPGDRDAIRRHATSAALDMIRHDLMPEVVST